MRARRIHSTHGVSATQMASAPTVRTLGIQRQATARTGVGNQALQRKLHACGVQAKLSISEPGDRFEREADRAADDVMRMPDPGAGARIERHAGQRVQRKCAACGGQPQQGKPNCAACEAEEMGIQRQPAAAAAPSASPSPAVPTPGDGAPLAADLRSFFEPRFDRDFGDVRIHTGAQAAASAHSLAALAYTQGHDVVFGEGQYAPGTSAGRRLLAHELAHVVQQSDAAEARERIQRQPQEEEELPDAPPEVEPLPPVEPPGPEPEFECKFDIFKLEAECCAPVPGVGRVCAPDPVTLMKKIREALAKMGKKKPGKAPSTIGICPPERQIPTPAPPPFRAGGCCSEGTFWSGHGCRSIPIGPCENVECKEDEINIGIPPCCRPRAKKEEPPPPPPPKERVIGSHEVFFQFDRPAGESTSSTEFDRALTGEGKTNFELLVEQLKADPALKVQLVGAASTEGPEDYNFDLAKRRALAVANALERAGIDRSRVADPQEDDLRGDCKPVGTGLRSCGEIGATGARDRRVLARMFDAR